MKTGEEITYEEMCELISPRNPSTGQEIYNWLFVFSRDEWRKNGRKSVLIPQQAFDFLVNYLRHGSHTDTAKGLEMAKALEMAKKPELWGVSILISDRDDDFCLIDLPEKEEPT